MRYSAAISLFVLAGAVVPTLAAPVTSSSTFHVAKRAPSHTNSVTFKRATDDLTLFGRAESDLLNVFARAGSAGGGSTSSRLETAGHGVSIVQSVVNTAHDIYNWIKGKRSVDELEAIFARAEPEVLEIFARSSVEGADIFARAGSAGGSSGGSTSSRLETAGHGVSIVQSVVNTAHDIYNWIKGKRSMDELESIIARAEPELNNIFARAAAGGGSRLETVSNGVGIVQSVVNTAHDIYNWIKGKRSVDELHEILARADPEVLDIFARSSPDALDIFARAAASGGSSRLETVSNGVGIFQSVVNTAHDIYNWVKGKRSVDELHEIFARADPEVLDIFARATAGGSRLENVSHGVNIFSGIENIAHNIYDWVKGKRELEELFARTYGDLYQREYAARSLYDLE